MMRSYYCAALNAERKVLSWLVVTATSPHAAAKIMLESVKTLPGVARIKTKALATIDES